MGLGQTLLTTLSLVLFTIAVVNANRMLVDRAKNYYEEEAIKQATIYASSLLDEISRKKFDAKVQSYSYQSPSNFTDSQSYQWGPSATAKNYVNYNGNPDTFSSDLAYKSIRGDDANYYFDDVDDYHGYIREVNTGFLKGFRLTVRVAYADTTGGVTIERTFQTFLKKVEVKVSNSRYMSDTLVFYSIVAY